MCLSLPIALYKMSFCDRIWTVPTELDVALPHRYRVPGTATASLASKTSDLGYINLYAVGESRGIEGRYAR